MPRVFGTIRGHATKSRRRAFAVLTALAAIGGAATVVSWTVDTTASLFDRIEDAPRARETRTEAALAKLSAERAMVTGMRLDAEVTRRGENDGWQKIVRGSPGDVVQWLVRVKNERPSDVHDVTVRTILSAHLSVIPGSVRIVDDEQDTEQGNAPLFQGAS